MKKGIIKKASTTYYVHLKSRQDTVCITVNEETPDHMTIYDGVEPCSGILRHWGTRKELRAELEELIAIIDNV
jgi:hypothetical protein